MNRIHVLDCTLRDGGYCNQWRFGYENIKKIIAGLVEARIDVIECGFLTDKTSYILDSTQFTNAEQIEKVFPSKKNSSLFVAMINYGQYDILKLPECGESPLDGIRVAFHKKDLLEAFQMCEKIQKKGYKVFLQPMVSLSYTDEEFLNLIKRTNQLNPYAFYIVDSFGVMKEKELTRFFYMVEHNLAPGILIGFHSHNNMQLAYANAQALVALPTNRNLIMDSSVYGMGRGAGNLNTELFVGYLNENIQTKYQLPPLLNIIDEVLNDFYQGNSWGYSLPNYISAAHNAHPNYAGYLDSRKTLTIEGMNEIFDMMDEEKKAAYDKGYIEELYLKYMEKDRVQEERLAELKDRLCGRKVLLIAPGKSSADERERIVQYALQNDIITFSVNYEYDENVTDFIFLSNLRRFRELDVKKREKCIVTSNIPALDVYLQTKYKELLNTNESVCDNAGMMLIKFLINMGVKKVSLAGMDGYSSDPQENYADPWMNVYAQRAVMEAMNQGMTKVLKEFSREIEIKFLTKMKYVKI